VCFLCDFLLLFVIFSYAILFMSLATCRLTHHIVEKEFSVVSSVTNINIIVVIDKFIDYSHRSHFVLTWHYVICLMLLS